METEHCVGRLVRLQAELRIRHVYTGSRAKKISGSRIRIRLKEFMYFNPFLSSGKYDPDLIFTHPGSLIGIRNTDYSRRYQVSVVIQHSRDTYQVSNLKFTFALTNECLLMLGLNGVLPLLDHGLCDVHVQWSRVSKIPEKIAIHSYWNHMKTGQF